MQEGEASKLDPGDVSASLGEEGAPFSAASAFSVVSTS